MHAYKMTTTEPRAEYIEITPEMAATWLKRHTNFRSVNTVRVKLLAQDIQRGRWHVNGESIKFTSDGVLFDGQHRLSAVVMANQPIYSLVTWSDDTGGVDRGMGRTFGQLLAFNGYSKTAITQATVRLLYAYEVNNEIPRPLQMVSDDVMMEYFQSLDYPTLDVCMGWGSLASRTATCPSSATYAAMMYLFTGADVDKTQTFHDGLVAGINLPATSPILVARNRFMWMATQGRRSGGRPPTRLVAALLIKAWNAYYNHAPIKLLKYLESEAFPVIAGLKK